MADGSVKIDVTVDDSDAKKKLDGVGDAAEDAAKKAEDLGDSSGGAGKGLSILDVAAGNLVSGGISSLISGIGDAVQILISLADETREFREDMAKLETAFTTTGHKSEDATKAYEDFYAILGESDRSVEAVNHLAELTDNTEDLSKWSTIAAGVTAKFGDSLPIEGLTEAANETAKVGQVTGPLADALNWAGISEDKFNEALKKCNSEQERATLITNTLNQEYSAAAEEYNALTAETQAARRATAEMEEAQARLGAAVEPLSTGITNLKAGFFNLGATVLETVVTNFTKAKDTTSLLTDEQVRLIDSTIQTGEKMRDMKLAADEAAIGISSNFNYTKSLADELFTLVDATGKVEEADRARVEFILGELNGALGTEYSMTGNIIKNYDTIKNSIYGVIEAKRAQVLLAQYEDTYAEAIKNVAAQEQQRADAAIEAGAKLAEFESAKLAEKEARIAYEKAIEDGATADYIRREGSKLASLADNTAKKERELEKAQDKYNELDNAVNESYNNISSYEEASTLILQGETDKAISVLNNYGNGFMTTAGKVGEAKQKELDALKQNVINTQVQLGILKSEYESKQGQMTETQKKEFEKRIANAEKEAKEALTQAGTLGGNLVEGIKKGAESKEWTLTGALKSIVTRGIEAAKKAANVNSPSKKMRDEVGKPLVEGLVKGVEQDGHKAIKATQKMSESVIDASKEAFDIHSPAGSFVEIAEMLVKGIEQGLKEYRTLAIKRVQELGSGMIEAMQSSTKDKVAVLKKEVEDLEKLREKSNKKAYDEQIKAKKEELKVWEDKDRALDSYAKKFKDQLEKFETIEKNYASDVLKVQEKLQSDIDKEWENYQNTFDNRVSAIKNELSLFDIAEKGDKVSKNDLFKAVNSQIDVLNDYNAALDTLMSKNIDPAFIEEMKTMGIDALPALEAINSMTDEELDKYVALWQDKNILATDAATDELTGLKAETANNVEALKVQAEKDLASLRTTYRENWIALAGEIGESMTEATNTGLEELGKQITKFAETGEMMMEGLIEGMESKEGQILDLLLNSVGGAIEKAQQALDINSPSRVTRDELGKPIADGILVGFQEKMRAIRQTMANDMQGALSSVKATIGVENARYGYNAGVADAGILDLTRAVGMQTAGINSLAGQFSRGSQNMRPVIIELNGRELGRSYVDLGGAETVRVGGKIGGVY